MNMAICNAELNRLYADVIGRSSTLLDGHQPNESVNAMASDPESTCLNSFSSNEGIDITAAGTEEDANFESFLHEDPNQCGWSKSAYFENDAMSISGPDMPDDEEREYVADHYIAEGASQQKEDKDLKGN